MKLARWVAVLLAGFLAAPVDAKETLVVCAAAYEPYYGESLPGHGPVVQILRHALQSSGYAIEVRFRPWVRVLREGEEGACDLIAAVWFDTGRERWMALSEPVLANQLGLLKRRDDDLVYSGMADLKTRNVVVGSVRGYIAPSGMREAGIVPDEATDDRINIRKLIAGRVRVALVDRLHGDFLARLEGPSHATEWLVTLQTIPLRIAVMKAVGEPWRRRLYDLNAGLATIRRNGTLARILREAGIPE